jgi:methionyl-tRNA formyltransferase
VCARGLSVRTVFIGTTDFAAGILRQLADSRHRPSLVVTRPDRPRGRGRKLAAPPVADAARDLALDPYQPATVNDDEARARIAEAQPDAICVCAFGALIKEPLISDYVILNVHPSLLPRWRGAAPIERAIMSGDSSTGVSIMRLTAGLDSGPVCAQTAQPIGAFDTYGSLAARLQGVGGELLLRVLDTGLECTPQDDALATYAEKIGPEDRELDPARPADELERTVRALTPHIGAHVRLADGSRLGVREARAYPHAGPPPGTVAFDGRRPVLGCAEGVLELITVQPPGRRAMSGEDFLRGHRR